MPTGGFGGQMWIENLRYIGAADHREDGNGKTVE
jgi:hypothetical protein